MTAPLGTTACEVDPSCTNHSELYRGLPYCVECSAFFCPDHGTLERGPDEGDWGRGTCANCKDDK